MKRPHAIFALVLLFAGIAIAGDKPAVGEKASAVAKPAVVEQVTAPNDQDSIVKELQRTEALFLKSVEGLSEAQWNFKPAEDKWSVAQCAEHLAAAEPLLRGMIAEAMKKDLTEEMKATARQDEKIMKGLPDRSQKFKAPEPLIPTNRYGSPAEAVAAFKKERAETIKLASSGVDLRTHGDKNFLFGPLDAYGWFLFQSGHVERHTLQIEEVKSNPNFPKS